MITVLSPAKSIDTERKFDSSDFSEPFFQEDIDYLREKISKKSARQLKKMMGISDALAELNVNRYDQWDNLDETHAAPAFTGEVYRGLSADQWNSKQQNFAQKHIRILSGLYGLLRPMDRFKPYRLEMGTKWEITKSKSNLYKYWGSKIANKLDQESDGVIINLASNEYSKAIDKKALNSRMITIEFKEFRNGSYKAIMTFAKNARGRMADYIVQNEINDPEKLKLFDWDNYCFNAPESTEDVWMFTR